MYHELFVMLRFSSVQYFMQALITFVLDIIFQLFNKAVQALLLQCKLINTKMGYNSGLTM